MATVDYSQSGALSTAQTDRYPREWPRGVVPFKHTVTVPTTQIDATSDNTLLYEFPASCMLDLKSLIFTATDMDTHGTPTLQWNFGLGDSDGTIDTELVTNSAIGQTAVAADNVDYVDDADLLANGRFIDASGEYLIANCDTVAATAAAGTLIVSGYYLSDVDATTASA